MKRLPLDEDEAEAEAKDSFDKSQAAFELIVNALIAFVHLLSVWKKLFNSFR